MNGGSRTQSSPESIPQEQVEKAKEAIHILSTLPSFSGGERYCSPRYNDQTQDLEQGGMARCMFLDQYTFVHY